MAREAITKSISFDPELFEMMEDTRNSLVMERSEFVKRCILNGIAAQRKSPGSLTTPLPVEMTSQLTSHSSRTVEGKAAAAKKRRR